MTWRQTSRNPKALNRWPGEKLRRFADRQRLALRLQLPPRSTRSKPEEGPKGSVTEPDE
ncbi:MAG: hypothetical protein Q7U02_06445 [Desulfosalsimonadaceae bacterium]|nr:hypothetical protein [Desulfosalsimonadaceae bacterium]